MTYTNVFSADEIPPAESSYVAYVITANTQLGWPAYAGENSLAVASFVELSGAGGFSIALPPASQVSVGEPVILVNRSAGNFPVTDYAGNSLMLLVPGVSQLFYITDNTTAAGTWGQLTYGAGSSSVAAGALAGMGTKAIGETLAVAAPVLVTPVGITIDDNHRGQVIEFTGGAGNITLNSVSSYSADFFCYVKNSGTGTLATDAYVAGGNTIDGSGSLGLQPGESFMLVSDSSSAWLTVGYGRSTIYQFSTLALDVSAGGTFTLSSAQASNKMITVTGNPSTAVTIVVPAVTSVYYIANNLSTAQNVTFKTASGTGSAVSQTQRAVMLCDGTNVTSAQTAPATSVQSLIDGSVALPSLNFSSKSNTGLYKFSSQGIGLTVNGVAQATSNGAGFEFPLGATTGGVPYLTTAGLTAAIGTTIQAYNANYVKSDTIQAFTKPQRSTPITDNDLSFDLSLGQNFTCAVAGAGTLGFTNLVAGQSGTVLLTNNSGYAIAKLATVKTDTKFIATISSAGVYRLSYYTDGVSVYVTTSGALA